MFFVGWMVVWTLAFRSAAASDLKLWYEGPATRWEEALPLGNGRLGVMVAGGPATEELYLNEETIWAGGPHNNINPEAREALPKIRRLIFEGRYREASDLCALSDGRIAVPRFSRT